jgi:hypothetical protein
VRAAVVEMLDAWAAVAPVDPLVAELCEAVAAPKCSADGRKLALEWLTNIAASGKVGDATVDSVKTATLGSMDKAVEVREASSRLMAELIEVGALSELPWCSGVGGVQCCGWGAGDGSSST